MHEEIALDVGEVAVALARQFQDALARFGAEARGQFQRLHRFGQVFGFNALRFERRVDRDPGVGVHQFAAQFDPEIAVAKILLALISNIQEDS